jgi:hypothetical protein
MAPAVDEAIADLRAAFPDNGVEVHPEAQGGAHVIVYGLHLGNQYRPEHSWVGFLVPYNYPFADVYPHYVDPTLARSDEQALGEGFAQPVSWHDRSATQISRRSNRWDPNEDTAVTKLYKVLEWLRSR